MSIKAVAFDLDGTMYKSIPSASAALHSFWIGEIQQKSGLSLPWAEELFSRRKEEYKSSTRVLELMGFGTAYEIIRRAEDAYMPSLRKSLKKDLRLQKMLAGLQKDYQLAVITNSSIENAHEKLKLLGVGAGIFKCIVGIERDGITKPHPKLFTELLLRLGQEAGRVMLVGDRPEIDLHPAKKLGMRTVWVTWGKTVMVDPSVDHTIESVYGVGEIGELRK